MPESTIKLSTEEIEPEEGAVAIWRSSPGFGYQDGEQEDSVRPEKGIRRVNFRTEGLGIQMPG